MTSRFPWMAAVLLLGAIGAMATNARAQSPPDAPPAPPVKIWTPPPGHLRVQVLAEQIMTTHPELISVTFHGVPPGAAPGTYAMFGGSYADRIGNPDDPDDIMVIETGVTILDPRWHRTKDKIRKFVVQTPLRDKSGENVGLLVLAYKNPVGSSKTDLDFYRAAMRVRDLLQADIPTFGSLFEPER